MKTIKAKYYLIPAIICLVVIGGLVYYYFLTDVAKEDKVSYLYIDDDDTADSVYIKLEPIATSHGLTGLKYLARYWGYAKTYVQAAMPSNQVKVPLNLSVI